MKAETEARAKAWNDAMWARIEERKEAEAQKRWQEKNADWLVLQELKQQVAAIKQVNQGGGLEFDNSERLGAFIDTYMTEDKMTLLPAGSAEARLRADRAKAEADTKAEQEAAAAKQELEAVKAEKARVAELYKRREQEAMMIMKNLQKNVSETALPMMTDPHDRGVPGEGQKAFNPVVKLEEHEKEALVEKLLVQTYAPIFVPTDYRYVSTRLGFDKPEDEAEEGD